MSDFIGLAGIIVTTIIGVLTIAVTWKISQLKKKRLGYFFDCSCIIPTKISNKLDGLSILYQNTPLKEPCILNLFIKNTGGGSISNPPIKVQVKGIEFLIPAIIEDIPIGYEDKWFIKKTENNECQINLEHINEKQFLNVRFYMDRIPKTYDDIKFMCPMKDVKIEELDIRDTNLYNESKKNDYKLIFSVISCVILIVFIGFLLGFYIAIELYIKNQELFLELIKRSR